jgi:signal transduction histidine kinase
LRQEGSDLQLYVADDGPGIHLAQRELVFERFYRGVGHEVSGSGLGLAIVRQAAARLQAKLEISDGIGGQGCAFSILIGPQS